MESVISKLLEWQEELAKEEVSEGMDNVLVDIFSYLKKQELKIRELESNLSVYETPIKH
ncbi:hypothetical protein [Halobacillus sp. B29]|uniref:hypothetical protein n=1 Tax=Halobacillus sp. B29 TaxID=3457432 RepID=UPI003FCC8966